MLKGELALLVALVVAPNKKWIKSTSIKTLQLLIRLSLTFIKRKNRMLTLLVVKVLEMLNLLFKEILIFQYKFLEQ